jgi:S-formylglutathione hydrolase FrmB
MLSRYNTRVRRTLIALSVAIVAAAITAVAAAMLQRQSHSVDERFESVALGGSVHALVVLPDGYATSGKRYPVVYFLHGLPASSGTYRASSWVAEALERAGQAILVMPQGARDGDSDPEYLNWGSGRQWETFVAEELPRKIDARFRTIRSRGARALVGLSAGGYGATILALHHLGTFSAIESWSGYFHPTDPTGTQALARGPATNAHTLVAALAADERHRPTFLGFYVGRGDTRFRDENVQFDRELSAARVPHVFEVYRGGHQTSLWQAHATGWLRMALAHLTKAA